jgi:hypothetical protein
VTFLTVSRAIREAGEEDHFLELMNTCIDPIPTDPLEREEAVYPFLDELEKVLLQEMRPIMTREDLKQVIHKWIDEKTASGPVTFNETGIFRT